MHIARALSVDPSHRDFRNYRRIIGRELANTHIALGDHAKAASSVRALLDEQPDQHAWMAGVLFAACATLCARDPFADPGLIDGYGDDAIEQLRRAAANGQLQPAIHTDESFAALRGRDDFRALIRQMRK